MIYLKKYDRVQNPKNPCKALQFWSIENLISATYELDKNMERTGLIKSPVLKLQTEVIRLWYQKSGSLKILEQEGAKLSFV